jgi:hypothetical protein
MIASYETECYFDIGSLIKRIIMFFAENHITEKRRLSKVSDMFIYICTEISAISFLGDEVSIFKNLNIH